MSAQAAVETQQWSRQRQAWRAAGIDDWADWWAAGCWRLDAARALRDAGLSPHHLLDSDRRPIEIDALSGIPVATAVADAYITADQAADLVRARSTLKWVSP